MSEPKFIKNTSHIYPGLVIKLQSGEWVCIHEIYVLDFDVKSAVVRWIDEDLEHGRSLFPDAFKWIIGDLFCDHIGLGEDRHKSGVIPFIEKVERHLDKEFRPLRCFEDSNNSRWWVTPIKGSINHVGMANNPLILCQPTIPGHLVTHKGQFDKETQDLIWGWRKDLV